MSYIAYLFEARSIQGYILDGGRLADQVAASNLVDALCREPLRAALEVLNLTDISHAGRNPGPAEVIFPRCAGGAFYAVLGGDEARPRAERLRDLWGIAAASYCPGLEFVQALAEGDHPLAAITRGTQRLAQWRSLPATRFPETPPLVRRSPRSGQPALCNDRLPENVREWADAATLRKRYARDGDNASLKLAAGLTQRFLDVPDPQRYHWPRNLEPARAGETADPDDPRFPFLPDNAYVAVIHADGNGLGQALMALRDKVAEQAENYQRLFRAFSDCIEDATMAAARTATAAALIPVAEAEAEQRGDDRPIMPARPIVLGGDDLTVIVRADLALPFTVAFLRAFETASAERLAGLRAEAPALAPYLTACAGIVFIKSSQPFHLANHLAEVLCARAKAASERVRVGQDPKPASLAFTRITTSVIDDTLRCAPLGDGGTGDLGARAYFVGADDAEPAPRWRDLDALTDLLARPELARGPVRQLFTLLGQDVADAQKRYRRWREVLAKDATGEPLLRDFDRRLACFGECHPSLPFVKGAGAGYYTPLSDALALRALGYGAVAATEEAHHE